MSASTAFSPKIPFEAQVYQTYVAGLKLHWRNAVYARAVADARAACDGLREPADASAIEEAMRRESPAYRLYGWLERHLQQFKYVGRHGMVPVMQAQQQRLTDALDAAARRHPQRLQLDASLALPDYYTRSDFHQHPGGIWSDDIDGYAYEWGANAFSFSMLDADRPYRWMARTIVDRFSPRSVIDLGCGFGKLCVPLKQVAPQAEVTGVDLAAPLLRLAHLRALEAQVDVRWVQANAEALPMPDACTEAVVSYWLFHELPVQAMRKVLRESLRVLQPGGVFASFDMHTAPGGIVGEWLHLGHAARNNEPYLPGLLALDMREELRAAGFTDVELVEAITGGSASGASAPLASSRTHTFTVAIGRKPGAGGERG